MSSCAAGATATGSSLDHHQQQLPPPPSSEQLCYVHCTLCDTVLAVSVPCTSLFKTVTVRCGHCANLLPVNLRALHLPPPTASTGGAANQYLFSPNSLGGAMTSQVPNHSFTQPGGGGGGGGAANYMAQTSANRGGANELPRLPTTPRPPEKRQRVPSAYNRFIKEEIQRIKAGNPAISHREAFSTAAKNWAHFPHIHFGLMPDQTAKRTGNMRPHHPQY